MREKAGKVSLVVVVAVIVVVTVLVALCPVSFCCSRTLAIRTQCQSNLHSFDLALSSFCYPPQNSYPSNLWSFRSASITPELLLCPGPGSVADGIELSMSNISRYADYVYVSGLSSKAPGDLPVIICPPINHSGKGGNVLWGDHSTAWVPKEEFDKLIDKLYADTNLTIVVSEALTKRSRGRYKSRP